MATSMRNATGTTGTMREIVVRARALTADGFARYGRVIAMDRAMRIPFKVSTTTSNFMIGVTAAASAGVYLGRGYIDPGLAMPVMLGVLSGALLGTKVLVRSRVAPCMR